MHFTRISRLASQRHYLLGVFLICSICPQSLSVNHWFGMIGSLLLLVTCLYLIVSNVVYIFFMGLGVYSVCDFSFKVCVCVCISLCQFLHFCVCVTVCQFLCLCVCILVGVSSSFPPLLRGGGAQVYIAVAKS